MSQSLTSTVMRLLPMWNSGATVSLVRSAGASFVVTSAAAIAAFLVQMLMAREVGVVEYGYYAYALSWAMLATVVAKFGLDTTALRVLSAARATRDWPVFVGFARASFSWTLMGSILAMIAMWVLTFAANTEWQGSMHNALLIAACLLPLSCIAELWLAWLQSLQRNVAGQLSYGLLRPLLMILMVSSVTVFQFRATAATLVAANAVALIGVTTTMALLLLRYWPKEAIGAKPVQSHAEWLRVSVPLFVISLSQLALARGDVIMIGAALDARSVGIYSVANQIATLVTFGIATTNAVTAPAISAAFASGDRIRLQQLVRDTSRLALLFTLPACVFLVVFGQWVLGLFGNEFVQAFYLLVVLMLGQLVIAVCGPVGFLLTMTAYQRNAVTVIVGVAVAQLILVFLLSQLFGVIGGAIGAAAGNAARSIILTWVVRTKLGISATAF